MLNVAIINSGVNLTNREALAVLADDREVIESGHIKVIAEETFRDGGINQHILQTVNIPYLASDLTPPAALSVVDFLPSIATNMPLSFDLFTAQQNLDRVLVPCRQIANHESNAILIRKPFILTQHSCHSQ